VIIGDPSRFAIEYAIHEAYERRSLLALGYFAVHLLGQVYGVRENDATLLACSLDEVKARIASRGSHSVPFITSKAGDIAAAVSMVIYSERQDLMYLGLPRNEFIHLITDRRIIWAPDGDEAFDDGSTILQFDCNDLVRLIAFNRGTGEDFVRGTLNDLWLDASDYYRTLHVFVDIFEDEWSRHYKTQS
jgi:hypothetical protein